MRKREGLTLVEVLVAMAILGIVLALITNWQTQTLQLTTNTSAQAQQLADLNDLTGYVGDRVRAAVRVHVFTGTLTVNSGSGNLCAAASPCLTTVLPVYNAAGSLSKYVLYIYRMQSRSVLTLDKVTDAWAEANVQVMQEFRSSSATTPADCTLSSGETFDTAASASCVAMRNLSALTSVNSFQPYLVSDYLTPADALPGGAATFDYAAASRSVTINVQSLRQVRGMVRSVPLSSVYTLTVQARNVP